MITLITAVPGSGKTLYSIDLIYKANLEKRKVYQNINGLDVNKFPNPDLIFQAPDDWRDTPDGSLVIYDEAQQEHLYPANAQRGLVSDKRLTAMETHRHTGHDLVFITQSPTFVHHHIRKLVGQHIHLYRAFGRNGSIVYKWSHTCDNPNDRKEQQRTDKHNWQFPKKYYSFYKSSEVHTHKFKMPKKAYFYLVLILVFTVPSFYFFFTKSIFVTGSFTPLENNVNKEQRWEAGGAAPAALPHSTIQFLQGFIQDSNSFTVFVNDSDNNSYIYSFDSCSFNKKSIILTCYTSSTEFKFYR